MRNVDIAVTAWRGFTSDESGQDVVEYALLAALVAIVSILVWQQLVAAVGAVYSAADAGVQVKSSCTPNPISAGGGCP